MRTEYDILLSGAPLFVEGVGEIYSPKLKSVFQNKNAYFAFCFVRSICLGDTHSVRKTMVDMKLRPMFVGMTDMEFDHCSLFDLVWTVEDVRNTFCGGLSLFFSDPVVPLPENKCFAVVKADGEDRKTVCGVISADNFNTVCKTLRTVSSQIQDDDEELKFGGENAKRLWEKHNKFEAEHPSEGSEDYTLSNMISKLACGNTSYTLLTIYELSVFQLYDQFEAYTQSRVSAIGEKSYSTWGGEDFDAMGWFHKPKNNGG